MSKRLRRALSGFALLAIACLSVSACASVNMQRARDARRHLGDRLYVERRGTAGPAIVFLPGLMGSTRYWDRVALQPLAATHRTLFLDELGFGRSPWPDGDYTLDDHLAAIRRTLLAEGATENVTLVGHSFGAVLAASYAERYPSEVKRLYLLGTPVFRDERQARARIRQMSWLAALFTFNRVLGRIACATHAATYPLLQRVGPSVQRTADAAVVEDAMLHWWPSVDGSIRNVLLAHPIEQALPLIGAKVVFIHGRRDGVTPIDTVRHLASRIGARLLETDDEHRDYGRSVMGLIAEDLDRLVRGDAAPPPSHVSETLNVAPSTHRRFSAHRAHHGVIVRIEGTRGEPSATPDSGRRVDWD